MILASPWNLSYFVVMVYRGPKSRSIAEYQGHPVVFRTKRDGPPYVHLPKHPLAGYRGYVPVLKLVAFEHRLAGAEDLKHRLVVLPIDGDSWNWDITNLRVISRSAYLPKAR